MKKKCNICGELKELSEFGKWSRAKDGLRAYCKSCKSKQDKRYKQYNREYMRRYYSYTARGRYFRLKENAKKQGFDFNMLAEDFIFWWEHQTQNCYYCGQKLTIGIWKKHSLTDLTVDRKNNKIGYTIDNIVLACRRCNLMKGAWLTENQMLEIAEKYLIG